MAFCFGAGYGSRTRPVCLGSRNSTDKLTLRCPHYNKGDLEIQPLFVEPIANCGRLCYNRNEKIREGKAVKIAVLGYSGSGKSTLARLLAEKYRVDILHFDTVQFLPGWVIRSDVEKTRLT